MWPIQGKGAGAGPLRDVRNDGTGAARDCIVCSSYIRPCVRAIQMYTQCPENHK